MHQQILQCTSVEHASNITNNSAQKGGGVCAEKATEYISGSSNFIYNSAQRYGGAVYLHKSVHFSDNATLFIITTTYSFTIKFRQS